MYSKETLRAIEGVQEALREGTITRDDIRAIHHPHPEQDLIARPWECLYTKGQGLSILRAWGHGDKVLSKKGKSLTVPLPAGTYTSASITWEDKKGVYGERLYKFILTKEP